MQEARGACAKTKDRQEGAVFGVSCLRVMLRLLRPASARNAARLRFVSRSVSSAIPTAAGDDFTKLKVAQLKEELDKLHVPHGHLNKRPTWLISSCKAVVLPSPRLRSCRPFELRAGPNLNPKPKPKPNANANPNHERNPNPNPSPSHNPGQDFAPALLVMLRRPWLLGLGLGLP